ncbi:MAG: DUF4190 domain-containing protein [Candidatus Nanopelagicales bacterium]
MSYPPPPSGAYQQPAPQQQNGMAVAALVLGIVAFVTCWVAIVPAVLAIVFGRIGMTKAQQGLANNGGMAKAGFVLGIVAAAIWGVFMLVILISAMTSSPSNDYMRY